jgi:hydrogenase-4 component B
MNLLLFPLGPFFFLVSLGIVMAVLMPKEKQTACLAWVGALASAFILWTGAAALFQSAPEHIDLWTVSGVGTLSLGLDPLTGLFLIITGLVMLPAAIAAAALLDGTPYPISKRGFVLLYWGLYFSIALILCAQDVLTFFLSWEAMSIFCYLLIGLNSNREGGDASYSMLAIGEAGTLAAVLGFLLLGNESTGLDFTSLAQAGSSLGHGARWAVCLLTLAGFGVKAGLVPVNFWLPRAYTAVPAPFVPILAGATLNLGLYGIFRVNACLLPATGPWMGVTLLIVGAVSAFVGILYATTENNLKTVLAHSSVENAGIILAGFGAALAFISAGLYPAAAIAMVASTYHLLNHAIYKTLLFIGTGAVEQSTGTCDLDRMGGIIRKMPVTAAYFLLGCLAISALPPFNGFVSEWLTLQSLLRGSELGSIGEKVVFALCGAALALTSALAITCFVKVFAMGFLGIERSTEIASAVECKSSLKSSMAILAVICVLLGITPTYIIPALDRAIPINGSTTMGATDSLVPPFFSQSSAHSQLPAAFVQDFHDIGAQTGELLFPGRGLVVMHRGGASNPVVFAMSTSYMVVALAVLLGITLLVARYLLSPNRTLRRKATWDGGVHRLLPEMTYTATGFSNPVRVIFDAIYSPVREGSHRETVSRHFRTAIRRGREEVYIVDRWLVIPATQAALWVALKLATIHHGRLNSYAGYVLVALIFVLIIGSFF